jgi:serine protease AprX
MRYMKKLMKPAAIFFTFAILLSMSFPFTGFSAAETASRLQPYLAEMAAASPDEMIRVIVQKADETDRAEKFAERLGAEIFADLGIINGFAARVLGSQIETLSSHASVQWVSYDAPMTSSALPKKVFYSVGTNIGNLRDGYPRITISSGTATFSTPQRDYVGVGDEIKYDGYKKAYIAERIDASTFKVITKQGDTPSNITNASVDAITRTFNSLQDALDSAPDLLGTSNLVSGNYQLNFPCYADATMVDKLGVDGYTTSATNNIRIYAPYLASEVGVSQRHTGKAGTGFVLDTPDGYTAIHIEDGYVHVDGLEIVVSDGYPGFRIEDDALGEIYISDNIIHGDHSGTTGISASYVDTSVTLKIWNNFIYGVYTGIKPKGDEVTAYIYNNSIFDVDSGIYNEWGWSDLTTKNNIFLGCDGTCFNRAGDQSYNISSDGSAEGTGSLRYKSASSNFVSTSSGSEDLHLKSGADAIGRGADLDSDPQIAVTLDIDGGSRPSSSPDIGADEFGEAYVPPEGDGEDGGDDGPEPPPEVNTFRETLRVDELSLTGSSTAINIVDSGITWDGDDGDFERRIHAHISGVPGQEFWYSYPDNVECPSYLQDDCDDTQDHFGHGTHVAGIAAGSGADSNGLYKGIAPEAHLVSLRVMDDIGMAYESNIVETMDNILEQARFMDPPVRVVNISINSTVQQSYNESPLCAAAEILWFHGIVVVASAGNYSGLIAPPANDPFVITVGATDEHKTADRSDDTIPTWSGSGVTVDGFTKPDIYAPGRDIISTLSSTASWKTDYPDRVLMDGQYFRMSGTSMSAPMVAGAAALLFDLKDLTPDQIKYVLINTGSNISSNGQSGKYMDVKAAANYINSHSYIPSANQDLMPHLLLRQSALLAYYANEECDEPVEQCDLGSVDWDSVNWSSVNWSSVNWSSVNWNSVNWSSVNWSSVNWSSVNWSSVNWSSVNWSSVNWSSNTFMSAVNWSSVNWSSVNWNSMVFDEEGGDDGGGGGGATSMHIHDLDGMSYMDGYRWRATVTITLRDNTGNPVANAEVTGIWTGGYSGSGSCVTGSDGQCSITSGRIGTYRYSTTFTVTDMTHGTLAYAPGDNNAVGVKIIRP